MRDFEMKFQDMQQELMNTQDKGRQSLQELSAREEEIVVLKIELSNLQEKYKAKLNEVSQNRYPQCCKIWSYAECKTMNDSFFSAQQLYVTSL